MMMQVHELARPARSPFPHPRETQPLRARLPERRESESPASRSMALMLDEVDYGMLLVNHDAHVQHVNRCARLELDDTHPLLLSGGALCARHEQDTLRLREAIAGAAGRGLRKLLRMGDGESEVAVAVVPLLAESGEGPHGVLLLLGKRKMCEELTIEWYARSRALTLAETAVLKGLCADLTPQEIASRQGVELSTVRTQIGSIRAKTGVRSIKALVRQVSMLPPLVGALREREPMASTPPSVFACMVHALHA